MIKKILQKIRFYRSIRLFKYVQLNHFAKNIIRTDNSRIIPYKNAVIDIAPSSKLYLGGGDIEIGCDLLKGSKTETYLRMRGTSIWCCEGGCKISYGSTIEILNNGFFDTQFFTVNSKSVIIASDRIHFGQDVMIGRNAVIYDSDHHSIYNNEGEITNLDSPIHIGDHVWIATNATVLKGTKVGNGSVIAANATANGNISENSLYLNEKVTKIRNNFGCWNRKHPV